jgi:sulfate transport system ATP-binding protein
MSIVLEELTKRYEGYPVVNRLSLEIPDGEFFVLIGPSGSGKSTVLRMIAGLNTVDRGRIWLHKREVTHLPPQQRGVGFVFQHYALFQHLSVADNVEFALRIRRVKPAERRRRRDELLEVVGLAGLGRRMPDQLSGGQQQRVALARALAHAPQVLLLDEPFGALDARVRGELREWLRRLHDETHTTTVIVTHDQEEAMEVADEVAVMSSGRIEQVGSPREVYEHPANVFVMGFVGDVNRLGDSFVRPHDLDLALEPGSATREAMIERIVHLGFEVRAELVRDDGEQLAVQQTRDEAQRLELERGQIVYVTPTRQTTFS